MQYFPVLTADQSQLIFTRRVGDGPNDDEDLVVSKKDEQGRWKFPESISKNINTQLNEGTCAISADGRRLIFTSCAGRDGIGSCDLYETKKVGEIWTTPKNLGRNVNTNEWESQPSLSADGRTLYFVSDRRSGMGRRDIWISTLDDTGNMDKGSKCWEVKLIHSLMRYLLLFMSTIGLYILPQMACRVLEVTIFFTVKKIPHAGVHPKILASLINDHEDQFSLFITAEGKKGYYSHEETLPSGLSRSKIFEVEIPSENQIKFRSNYVKGIIRDKISHITACRQRSSLSISKIMKWCPWWNRIQ